MCMSIYLKRLLYAYVFGLSFTDQGMFLFNKTNVLLLVLLFKYSLVLPSLLLVLVLLFKYSLVLPSLPSQLRRRVLLASICQHPKDF